MTREPAEEREMRDEPTSPWDWKFFPGSGFTEDEWRDRKRLSDEMHGRHPPYRPAYDGGLNTVSRMGWAWQAKKLRAAGYWIDGGTWPWLRFVRKAKMDDYIYGKLGENKLRGLEGWMEDQK